MRVLSKADITISLILNRFKHNWNDIEYPIYKGFADVCRNV